MRDFGQCAAGREFPVRAAHHLPRALDRAQQTAQRGAVRRSKPEGATNLAGGQRLRIGAQKLDEFAIRRQPGAGMRVASVTAGHWSLALIDWRDMARGYN